MKKLFLHVVLRTDESEIIAIIIMEEQYRLLENHHKCNFPTVVFETIRLHKIGRDEVFSSCRIKNVWMLKMSLGVPRALVDLLDGGA